MNFVSFIKIWTSVRASLPPVTHLPVMDGWASLRRNSFTNDFFSFWWELTWIDCRLARHNYKSSIQSPCRKVASYNFANCQSTTSLSVGSVKIGARERLPSGLHRVQNRFPFEFKPEQQPPSQFAYVDSLQPRAFLSAGNNDHFEKK